MDYVESQNHSLDDLFVGFDDITVADAKCLAGWLNRLSDEQIKDAFRAGNYAPSDVELLAQTVRKRSTHSITLPRGSRRSREVLISVPVKLAADETRVARI